MKCKGHNSSGDPCGKNAMKGRDYCRTHGGTKPIGPAHPQFKHGRRSKFLPARLAATYEEALRDPKLLEYREDAAMLETRLSDVLQHIDGAQLWNTVADAFRALQDGMKSGNQDVIGDALTKLHAIIQRGQADALRWQEVYKVVDVQGRVKDREHKRQLQLRQMITIEQFLAFIGQIVEVATQTIHDKDVLRRFTAALNSTWAGGRDTAIDAGH